MMRWLVKLIISFNLIASIENRTCSGVTGMMCCDGFKLNNITGKCEKCPIGYHLKDCLEKCNTPTYGEECQFICDCPYYDCHFAHGCLQEVESFTHNRPKISTNKVLAGSTDSSITVGVSISTGLHLSETHDFRSTNEMFTKTTVTYFVRNNNFNVFKENIVVYVITSLIGVFVFFFALCVLTNMYFKCCRKKNTESRMEEIDLQKTQYKSLRFVEAEPEAILHIESQEQTNTDFTYLTPVFSRIKSCEEASSNKNETVIIKNQSFGQRSGTTSVGLNIAYSSNEMPQQDVYIDISDGNDKDLNPEY